MATTTYPILDSGRLRLRPLTSRDLPAVRELAGDRAIADTTISIPHPLSEEAARHWIHHLVLMSVRRQGVVLGMERKGESCLVGAAVLRAVEMEHRQAELSFWVGRPFWGQGYASEAARVLVRYGMESLGLNRIYAHHMARNPASGRVLEKAGFRQEGRLRQRVRKWDVYEDVILWAILRSDLNLEPAG